ncbi:DNA-binding protein [Xanthobacter sediminis]|uniref:DNA-binding protein n=1 Tax=Xanthobacter sediminis TaxID=3119926 RepID=UPI00372B3A5C
MPRSEPHSGLVLNFQTDPDSIQAAFLRRAMSALERIAATAPAKALTEALAAPTGAGALAQLLSHSELIGAAVADLDPLVPALARNVEHRRELLKRAGGVMSAEEAGKIAGVSRQAIDKRRRGNAILAIREGSDWKYPACQFQDGEVLLGIADVVRGLETQGAWVALDFLLSADSALGGRSPLEALRQGDRASVERLVRANAEDGFA